MHHPTHTWMGLHPHPFDIDTSERLAQYIHLTLLGLTQVMAPPHTGSKLSPRTVHTSCDVLLPVRPGARARAVDSTAPACPASASGLAPGAPALVGLAGGQHAAAPLVSPGRPATAPGSPEQARPTLAACCCTAAAEAAGCAASSAGWQAAAGPATCTAANVAASASGEAKARRSSWMSGTVSPPARASAAAACSSAELTGSSAARRNKTESELSKTAA